MLVIRIIRTLAAVTVLVVVGATLYFGVYRPNVEAARAEACRANLRQLFLSVLMYTQDYDDVLPPATSFFELEDQIHPYTKNWSLSFCPVGNGDEPRMPCYGWNYRLAGKSVALLGALAKEPILFDRKPWHQCRRNAITFDDRAFTPTGPVPMRKLSDEEVRQHTEVSWRLCKRLHRAWRWRNWQTADRLYAEALEEAGGNPRWAPSLYQELIAVQCTLGKLSAAEATFRQMTEKYPDASFTPKAAALIENAKRRIAPDMESIGYEWL